MAESQLKPVCAIVGEDTFLQLDALSHILAQLPKGTARMDVDGELADLRDVLDELRSFSMFSAQKVVVMRNADDFVSRFREALEKYVDSPSTSATLILRIKSLPATWRITKLIAKNGEITKADPPKRTDDIAKWAIQHARKAHNMTLAPDAANLLAELIGNDLGRMDNELAKLSLQYDSGRISAAQVSSSVAFQREQAMWDMTNELAAGRKAEAIRRWRHLVQLDSSAEFRAVTWLSMWLENVRKAIDMMQSGTPAPAICQQLRIWPRSLQDPFIRTVRSMGGQGVRRAVDLLVEIDRQNKSGIGTASDNVERFLVSV